MRKYLYNFIDEVELNVDKASKEEILTKISFFSHERLIHLMVTLFFALITIGFTIFCLVIDSILLYMILFILYVMLLFYVIHYYRLENGVQQLYKLYDKVKKLE